MKIQSTLALAFATAFGVPSVACSTASSGTANTGGASIGGSGNATAGSLGSGGSNSAGDSGAAGGATQCTNVTPCGGSIVGTWKVTSSCLTVSGDLDRSTLGLDAACRATVSGSRSVTGSWTAKADGTYLDQTTTQGTEQIAMSPPCLNLSGTTTTCARIGGPLAAIGYESVDCKDDGKGGCACTGVVNQMGGIGRTSSDPQKNGNYTVAGNVLTNDGNAPFSYCVAGNKLTLTPTTTAPISAGTIVLESGALTGVGGASSNGGAGGSGPSGGTAGSSSSGGSSPSGGSGGTGPGVRGDGPCDIYAAAKTPCAAAYSMVRALSKSYTGPLYQVRNGSSAMNTGTGGMTKDIGITADGFADSAVQDAFCNGSTCTISLLYDQSGNKNNLKVAPKGLSAGGTYAAMDDFESSATKGSLTVGGHKVYSLYMAAREGYRLTAKGAGMPLGDSDQGVYMLADGTHSGTACCWDFGNVTTDPTKYHTMNTLFLGTGFWGKGAGNGPWFLGDFEAGVWAGGSGDSSAVNANNPTVKVPFALGMLKTSSGKYAIRVADLQTATDLTTAYDGNSPKPWDNQGGILLGIGADNSNNSWGTFFEGAITAGRPSNDTDLAVMKNVQATGYGK